MTASPVYLSVLVPNPSSDRRVDWSDQASLHRYIMQSFGDLGAGGEPRSKGGILFRSEAIGGGRRLLVQSVVQPLANVKSIDIRPTLDALVPGQRCRMRLDVNPVQRVSRTGADRPLPESEVPSWITSKLKDSFQIDQFIDLRTDIRRVKGKKIVVACVDAVVRVTSPDDAREAVLAGVGRRKSHGCGLVSLIPVAGA
jgi:CRISPR system Cascade subunit CasE